MRFFFQTFGCRLNQAESARAAAVLAAAGWTVAPNAELADVVVVNSCMVTLPAESECIKFVRRVRLCNRSAKVVLAGCMAPQGEVLAGVVNLLVPQEEKERLGERILEFCGVAADAATATDVAGRLESARAFLKVQDGCDFFCAYCIVPHRRGAPWSKPLAQVLDEARALVARGFREIVVTGCNLSLFAEGLPKLAEVLCGVERIGRVRLGSVEPGSCEVEIAELMARERKLCRFLHLPVQSGSDRVLKAMGRRYSAGELRRRLDRIVKLVPDVALGCDVITGFPGEREGDFEESLQLVRDYPFSNVHVFPYSERPGTPAAELPESVAVTTRRSRARAVRDLGDEKRRAFAKLFELRSVECLIEGVDAQTGIAHGWTEQYLPLRFKALGHKRRELVKVAKVFLALGSNLGDRAENIRQAIERLGAFGTVLQEGPVVESEPVGMQGEQFLNTVVLFETVLPPLELLEACQGIETALGRPSPHPPMQPRTIDIDIIDYEGVKMESPRLTLPHLRAAERAFVQEPLQAIIERMKATPSSLPGR